ncbi:MAG TPA: hypothetical protein VFP44_07850 [Usitatibacter sp.]|nr:hypothetical protein [Usitatibacter sp.]
MQSITSGAVPVKNLDPRSLAMDTEPSYRVRRATGTVVQVQAPARDILRVRVAVDGAPFMFAPGQHADVSFNGCVPRQYAMANRPGDPLLEFHVPCTPVAPDGFVATAPCDGALVRLLGPYGIAFRRRHAGEPMLLIAADSGLAAIKSILLSALADAGDDIGPIHLYHGVREACDLYDGDLLANAGGGVVHYVPTVLTPSIERVCRHGSLVQAIESDFPALAGFKVHLAGPRALVEECADTAVRLGAREEDLYAHPFDAPREGIATTPKAGGGGLLRAIFRG